MTVSRIDEYRLGPDGIHVRRSNPVPAANRFHMDFLTKNSCYENTVLFAQYSTLIQIKLQ
jgi:hypothetical protein